MFIYLWSEFFCLLCAAIMKSAVGEGGAEFNQTKNQPWMNFYFEKGDMYM